MQDMGVENIPHTEQPTMPESKVKDQRSSIWIMAYDGSKDNRLNAQMFFRYCQIEFEINQCYSVMAVNDDITPISQDPTMSYTLFRCSRRYRYPTIRKFMAYCEQNIRIQIKNVWKFPGMANASLYNHPAFKTIVQCLKEPSPTQSSSFEYWISEKVLMDPLHKGGIVASFLASSSTKQDPCRLSLGTREELLQDMGL